MGLQASVQKKIFHFNFSARTSRGLMSERVSWLIKIWDDSSPSVFGIGECGPLPGLSVDDVPDFEQQLIEALQQLALKGYDIYNTSYEVVSKMVPKKFPSIIFGLETAWLDLQNGGHGVIFKNDFIKGKALPINGLIWMGEVDFMMRQVSDKIAQGYNCLKLKIGGLDFDREVAIIKSIREKYASENLTIRLDANGAFSTNDALLKLKTLAAYNIHSIEQPIKPGLAEMGVLCSDSPIPIALDEELIGVEGDARATLLQKLKPTYIILKPSLHGLTGCHEWIKLAESIDIGWWITSALESSIGLNAICQFTANYPIKIPQGLGTGAIYKNNFASPLKVQSGQIYYEPSTFQ